MKFNELKRKIERAGWYIIRHGKGSHVIDAHNEKSGTIILPAHGSAEVGKGLEKNLKGCGVKITPPLSFQIHNQDFKN